MRRKILRNRARENMRVAGIEHMNRAKSRETSPLKREKSPFAKLWHEYAAMPIARTRRRAKAGA